MGSGAAKSKKVDSYVARAGAKATAAAAGVALAEASPTGYSIEVRFLGGLTATQKAAFSAAADRWTKVIVGAIPPVTVDGEVVAGLLILAQGVPIDGPGKILGQAGPTHLRPAGSGPTAFLPAKGTMSFDTDDLLQMQQNGTLKDVIAHEMGHVIGIGTVWPNKGLLNGAGGGNPTFVGAAAKQEFGKLKGSGPAAVPVENTGGPGTQDSHWRETVFRNELMTGFVDAANNPLSRMTVASLKDLGYTVNLDAAEPYALPNLAQLAEAGVLGATEEHDHPHALTIIPITLPPDSLVGGGS